MNLPLAAWIRREDELEGKIRMCVRGPNQRFDFDLRTDLVGDARPRHGDAFDCLMRDGTVLRLALVRWIDSSTALCVMLPAEKVDA